MDVGLRGLLAGLESWTEEAMVSATWLLRKRRDTLRRPALDVAHAVRVG